MATREIVAKLATAGDSDKRNVALIGEGDNFKTEGRPNSATATNESRPYRRGRQFSIWSAAEIGDGDTSAIADVREQVSARATIGAGKGDSINLFVAVSATRKGRGDKDLNFRTKFGESDSV